MLHGRQFKIEIIFNLFRDGEETDEEKLVHKFRGILNAEMTRKLPVRIQEQASILLGFHEASVLTLAYPRIFRIM